MYSSKFETAAKRFNWFLFWSFGHLNFEFVSDFDIRISGFPTQSKKRSNTPDPLPFNGRLDLKSQKGPGRHLHGPFAIKRPRAVCLPAVPRIGEKRNYVMGRCRQTGVASCTSTSKGLFSVVDESSFSYRPPSNAGIIIRTSRGCQALLSVKRLDTADRPGL